MKKLLITVALICVLPVCASAKRISEYATLVTLADTDKILVSDTSDGGREKAVGLSVLKTYTLTDAIDLTVDGMTIEQTGTEPNITIGVKDGVFARVGEAGSFAFDTFPAYEDSAHTSGIAVNANTLAVYSNTASKWLTASLTDSLDPTPATPTLSSATIGTDGETLTLVGSISLTVGAGGNGGFNVDCSTAGSDVSATYASGSPGTSLVYTLGSVIVDSDTCDLDYTQPGNGIEATTGGIDLASITSAVVTNNSTQSSGGTVLESVTGGADNNSKLVGAGSNTRMRGNLYEAAATLNDVVEVDFKVTGRGDATQYGWIAKIFDADSRTAPLQTLLATSTNTLTGASIPANGVDAVLTFTFSATDIPQNAAIMMQRSDGSYDATNHLSMWYVSDTDWGLLMVHTDGTTYFARTADYGHIMTIRD